MLVSDSLWFTVLQPSLLSYPIIVSNPIVEIKVRSNFYHLSCSLEQIERS